MLRRYSPYQVVWTRYAVHLLVLMLWAGRSAPWRTRRPGLQLLSSLCMLSMPICFVMGAERIGAQNTWAVFWVSPLMMVFLGWLLLRDPPRPFTWGATGAACVGAAAMIADRPLPALPDLLLPLGMALSFASYLVLTRVLRMETTASKLFYTGAGVFLSLTPAMRRVFVPPDPEAIGRMVAIALLGLLALDLFDRALEAASVDTAAPFVCAVVLWQAAVEVLRGLPLGPRGTAGAVIVTAALVAVFGRLPPTQTRA